MSGTSIDRLYGGYLTLLALNRAKYILQPQIEFVVHSAFELQTHRRAGEALPGVLKHPIVQSLPCTLKHHFAEPP